MRQRTSSSKQIWPIPAWVVALGALILLVLFVASYILFWPRHPYAPRSGPVAQQQSPGLSSRSSGRLPDPSEQATAEATPSSQPLVPSPPLEMTVPAGTPVVVRTSAPISSDADPVGSRFSATLVSPIEANGQTAVPQGSAVVLRLAEKKKTGFFHRSLQVKLALSGISVNGRIYSTQAETADIKAGSSTPKGKKALVVLPNTELTFTFSAPFTILAPSGKSGQ